MLRPAVVMEIRIVLLAPVSKSQRKASPELHSGNIPSRYCRAMREPRRQVTESRKSKVLCLRPCFCLLCLKSNPMLHCMVATKDCSGCSQLIIASRTVNCLFVCSCRPARWSILNCLDRDFLAKLVRNLSSSSLQSIVDLAPTNATKEM